MCVGTPVAQISLSPECDHVLDDACAGLPFLFITIIYYIFFAFLYFRGELNLGIIEIVLKRSKLSS